MRSEQQVIIQFLLQANANADNIHRRLQAQFTDDAYRIRSVRRRCQFARQGRAELHNDARSGRAAIGFTDTKTLSALRREPFRSPHLIAEVVGVSYLTLVRHLPDSLGMKNFHWRRVPYEWTPDLCRRRLEICGYIKTSLAGRIFNDVDKLLEAIIKSLNEIQPSELRLVFHHCIEQLKSN
jgi:hypothetical protein